MNAPCLPAAEGRKPGWIPVRGQSMWPVLRSGDMAGLFAAAIPAVGEVAVARIGGQLVAHRVIAHRGRELILRGDNCAQPDPAVPLDKVLGTVRLVSRRGRVLEQSEWDRPIGRIGTRISAVLHRLAALGSKA